MRYAHATGTAVGQRPRYGNSRWPKATLREQPLAKGHATRTALWHRLWPWPKGHAGRVWPRCANDAVR
ncbi:MAG: hypothetical protein F6K55_17450 [Moorea sp. SIO4A3]|nr:hypothetical protein [Moorena sp. SIO4A3]